MNASNSNDEATPRGDKRQRVPIIVPWRFWCLVAAYSRVVVLLRRQTVTRGGWRDVFLVDDVFAEDWCAGVPPLSI